MQKRPTKAELRQQLDDEVQQFLAQGGQVKSMPRGATGLENGRYNALGFDRPKEERTDVSSLLNIIDERRHQQRKTPLKPPASKPKKKIIYDDFGEPVRIIWE